jgi:hypothetical protein
MNLTEFFSHFSKYKLEYKSFTVMPFSITFSLIDLQDNTEKGSLTVTIEQNKFKASIELSF